MNEARLLCGLFCWTRGEAEAAAGEGQQDAALRPSVSSRAPSMDPSALRILGSSQAFG